MSTGADVRLGAGAEAAAIPDLAAGFRSKEAGRRLGYGTIALTGGLLLLALLWLIPLAWIVTTAIKPEPEIIRLPVHMIPEEVTLANFVAALTTSRTANIAIAFANSTVVAIAETILTLAIDSMAAYALARLSFRGRGVIFAVIVGSIMVPPQITLVPLYLLFQQVGWLSSYQALVLPGLSRAFGVFLLRQFFLTIPVELEEAARLDGCGPLRVFWHVILPLSRAPLATLGIFTFMGSWNAFEGPLIFTDSLEMRTLPIGITIFQGRYNIEYGPLMAAATLAALPVTIAFLIFQKYIIKGISLTGLAGR